MVKRSDLFSLRVADAVSRFAKRAYWTGIGALLCTAAAAQGLPPVSVAVVESARSSDFLRLTGSVTSERTASLSPRVSGLVSSVRVDAGDRVDAGKALIDLDSKMARLALERSIAAVEEARAELAEKQRLYEEARNMFERALIPETRLHAAEAEQRVIAAKVARLVAEQRQQQEIVRRHTLVAPFAGVISRRLTDPGEWVETGTAVIELVDLRRLRIDVQVPQERYRFMKEGLTVKVEPDAFPGQSLKGKVMARVPVNNPDARTFLVRVAATDNEKVLLPGMSAQVVFPLVGEGKVTRVPRDAVLRRPDGSTSVWIVGEGDAPTVSERRVELGTSLRGWIDVRRGLESGMRVVVRGNETLNEGQQVKVISIMPGISGAH